MAVVLAIAAAAMMFSMSGYGVLYQNNPADGLGPMQSSLNETASNESVENGVEGQISGEDPSLVSMTVNGASSLGSVLAFIALMPVALQNLGFPFWFAYPVGLVVQLFGFIALSQVVIGRILR
jgi:hypothetical protein